MWDKGQMIVILSWTNIAKNKICQRGNDTVSAMKYLICG